MAPSVAVALTLALSAAAVRIHLAHLAETVEVPSAVDPLVVAAVRSAATAAEPAARSEAVLHPMAVAHLVVEAMAEATSEEEDKIPICTKYIPKNKESRSE